jgi:hypothetical protein
MEIDDLQIGKAGEYMVCADLILKGHIAFPSEQGLPYDVVADINGKLIKIQVKTTRTFRPIPQRKQYTPAYLFHIKRCGKGGGKTYQEKDFDIMALVALDTKIIGYLNIKDCKRTLHIRPDKLQELTLEKLWK